MPWYREAKEWQRRALRKHNLNADLHIHAMEDPNTGVDVDDVSQRTNLQSICASAVLKGLDVIGIVSHNSFAPGNLCKQIIQEKAYDLTCLAGVETKSAEGTSVVVFDTQTIPQAGTPLETICQNAHQEGGTVMAIQPNKRTMQQLNKIVGTPAAPDFIEIFNDITRGGYSNAFIDIGPDPEYQLTMDSAARTSAELDKSVMMTRIPRDYLVERGVIGEEQGVDYVPPYLRGIEGEGTIGGVTQQWATAQ